MGFAFLKPDGFPEEGENVLRHFLDILGEYDTRLLKELLNLVSDLAFQEGVKSVLAEIAGAVDSAEDLDVN